MKAGPSVAVNVHTRAHECFTACFLWRCWCVSITLLVLQLTEVVQEELLTLLRSQQRQLTELRGQIEAMQTSIMAQVEHALTNHQEQERILHYSSISRHWTTEGKMYCHYTVE